MAQHISLGTTAESVRNLGFGEIEERELIAVVASAKKEVGFILSRLGYIGINEPHWVRADARWILMPPNTEKYDEFRINKKDINEVVLIFRPEKEYLDTNEKYICASMSFSDEADIGIGSFEVHFNVGNRKLLDVFFVI